jgi:hypothetical protein
MALHFFVSGTRIALSKPWLYLSNANLFLISNIFIYACVGTCIMILTVPD